MGMTSLNSIPNVGTQQWQMPTSPGAQPRQMMQAPLQPLSPSTSLAAPQIYQEPAQAMPRSQGQYQPSYGGAMPTSFSAQYPQGSFVGQQQSFPAQQPQGMYFGQQQSFPAQQQQFYGGIPQQTPPAYSPIAPGGMPQMGAMSGGYQQAMYR